MEVSVYNQKGKEVSSLKVSEAVFGVAWNGDSVHQVVTSMQTSARTPYAHTKDRSEVSGGGKKPWKQKGTGRARHGSTRSPIWRKGGVAFGPRNDKNFDRKVNKKLKSKVLAMILSKKMKDNEIIFVDAIKFDKPQTKLAQEMVKDLAKGAKQDNLATKRKNAAIVAIYENDINLKKSFSNLAQIKTSEVRNISPIELLKYKYVIIENPKESVSLIEGRLGLKNVVKKVTKKTSSK